MEARNFKVGDKVAVRSGTNSNKFLLGEIEKYSPERDQFLVDVYPLNRHEYYNRTQLIDADGWFLRALEKGNGVYEESREEQIKEKNKVINRNKEWKKEKQ